MIRDENEVSYAIIGAAIEVHRTLGGPGLLESAYERALAVELKLRGYHVDSQLRVPMVYKGTSLGAPFKLDLIVNDCVIVECKSVETYNSVYEAQALTYLRLTGRKLALVINFGEATIQKGVHRVVNGL